MDGRVSKRKMFSFGIKKYSYDKEGNTFHIYINDIFRYLLRERIGDV